MFTKVVHLNITLLIFSDNVTRPILIVGPLSEAVLDKLISDYPDKFARCEPEYMNCDQEALEKVIVNRRKMYGYELKNLKNKHKIIYLLK